MNLIGSDYLKLYITTLHRTPELFQNSIRINHNYFIIQSDDHIRIIYNSLTVIKFYNEKCTRKLHNNSTQCYSLNYNKNGNVINGIDIPKGISNEELFQYKTLIPLSMHGILEDIVTLDNSNFDISFTHYYDIKSLQELLCALI